MKINITQEDINNGHLSEPDKCPIALAIMGEIQEATNVHVDTEDTTFYVFGKLLAYWNPEETMDFISAFDSGDIVEECVLHLNLQEEEYEN